jgi:hypothetical protein
VHWPRDSNVKPSLLAVYAVSREKAARPPRKEELAQLNYKGLKRLIVDRWLPAHLDYCYTVAK